MNYELTNAMKAAMTEFRRAVNDVLKATKYGDSSDDLVTAQFIVKNTGDIAVGISVDKHRRASEY